MITFSIVSVVLRTAPCRGAEAGDSDGFASRFGYSAAMRLGAEVRDRLPAELKEQIISPPVFLKTELTPSIDLAAYETERKTRGAVFVSIGLIDLVNQFARAKAIDKAQPGYFTNYLSAVAQEDLPRGVKSLADFPATASSKDALLNDQLSDLNSILGVIVGIQQAHHYLGHYKKYAARLNEAPGRPASIHRFLTREEWDEACERGTRSSLNAGCTVEGAVALFEAFDQMPLRPAWVAAFLPESVQGAEVAKRLKWIQEQSFKGK